MKTSPRQFRFSLANLGIAFTLAVVGTAWLVSPPPDALRETGDEFDVAILGKGWFVVDDELGRPRYTRLGRFAMNANGQLVIGDIQSNLLISPGITIPSEWRAVRITPTGDVSVLTGGETDWILVGQLQLARFTNPAGLVEVLPGVYEETTASGTATLAPPGQGGIGLVKQGWSLDDGVLVGLTTSDVALAVLLCVTLWTLWEVRRLRDRIVCLEGSSPAS